MITSLSMLLNTDFGFWTFMNGCLWIIFCLDLFWLYNIVKMSVCLVFNNKLVDIREGKYKCNSNDIKTKRTLSVICLTITFDKCLFDYKQLPMFKWINCTAIRKECS
ncbi:hypothetical protein GJ496_009175 [Pomphorhynchus laevis]|nr:hypothetical protein GJ496_009175 [Pomphorhynchus laevis]